MSAPSLAQEALSFWKLARAHNAVSIALGPDCAEAKLLRLDIECVAMHSDWPLLRDRAEAVLVGVEAMRVRA